MARVVITVAAPALEDKGPPEAGVSGDVIADIDLHPEGPSPDGPGMTASLELNSDEWRAL